MTLSCFTLGKFLPPACGANPPVAKKVTNLLHVTLLRYRKVEQERLHATVQSITESGRRNLIISGPHFSVSPAKIHYGVFV
jgi:hypothetical protein